MELQNKHPLRMHINRFLSGVPVPPENTETTPRESGGEDYAKRWCVRGSHGEGLFASISDTDDVIELGLHEKNGDTTINVLHVCVILESDGEDSELNCVSEMDSEFNFDTYINDGNVNQLDRALIFFGDLIRG